MQNGKNIKIFLSSTFKDMDAERDLIMNRVAPMLQERLASEGITIQFIDLRWGVNTQDADEEERENTVLRECISEIRQSRPFFIGLLGDRYGWIPSDDSWNVMLNEMTEEESNYIREESKERKSVTELEILIGALMDADSLRRSFFCFRNPEVYEQMDDATRRKFCNLDAEADRKLTALKQKIVKGCEDALCTNNIYEYDCMWDGQSLTGIDNLANFLCQELYQQILLYHSSNEVQNPENEFLQLLDADQKRVEREVSTFIADEANLIEIEKNVYSLLRPTLVHGLPGIGKTALLCKLYSRVTESIPLIHFCRQDEDPTDIFKKWLSDPRLNSGARYGLEEDVCIEELSLQLLKVQKELNVVLYLFIDDLHLLKDVHKLLNSSLLSDGNVMMVATIDESATVLFEYLKYSDKADLFRMPSVMTEQTTRDMITQQLRSVGKSLPAVVMNKILSAGISFPSYKYPLWTQLVVKKLTMLSAEDYENIRQRGEGDDAITQYLTEMVEDIAANAPYIEPMFSSILFNAGKFFSFDFFWMMVRLLVASEYGLREEDFKQLLGEHWDQLSFSACKRWLGNFLVKDEQTESIDFAYPCYRKVLRHFCQDKDEGFAAVKSDLAGYFFGLYQKDPVNMYVCREVAAIVINMGNEDVMKEALSSTTSSLWPNLVSYVTRLVSSDIPAGKELLSKVIAINDNGKALATDVAMQFYQLDNSSMATKIAEMLDADLMDEFYEGSIPKYNPNAWEYMKMDQIVTQIHYAGFMAFADDMFMSTLLTNMLARDCDILADSGSDNEDKDHVRAVASRFINLWGGGDDELEELDTSDFSAEELVEYAEQLLFVLFAPRHAETVLNQYEHQKGNILSYGALEIRANTLRCIIEMHSENPKSVYDYYEQLRPHLKVLPDNAAVLAACKFLMLMNIVDSKDPDNRITMSYRADEASHTFNSVLRVYEQGESDCELLLQLCFYRLCSTSEYCIKEMLYRSEHEKAKRAAQTLYDAVGKMKQTKRNTMVTVIANSLANSVFSNYYEQYGDNNKAFYYFKLHEYGVSLAYQRFHDCFDEIERRYASALDETGWKLLAFYHQIDEADKNVSLAMTIFRKLFENTPTDLSATDLLQCCYRKMRTLREKKLYDESIALGRECLRLVSGMENVNPDVKALNTIHDEIGDQCCCIGHFSEACSEIQKAAEGFWMLYESDPQNENLMRDVIVCNVHLAQLLAFNTGQVDMAIEKLRDTEPVVKKALEQMPDSLKVRNIAIAFYVSYAKVDMVAGELEKAGGYLDMVIGSLYHGIVQNRRADDYPLLLDCLKQLFEKAVETKSIQMAEACASMEYQIKREFIDKRMLAIEQADLAATEQRLALVENMKGN